MNTRDSIASAPSIKIGHTNSLGHLDTGHLSIAVNSHLDVVAVISTHHNGLLAAVGKLDSSNITLGDFTIFDTGFNPTIALNTTDQVVVVYQVSDAESVYRIGTRSDSGITWCSSYQLDLGIEPGVAINYSGQVVEVHRSQNIQQLYYNVGNIVDDKIKFLNSVAQEYCTGRWPKVSLNDSGQVVEVDTGITGTSGVWYHTGSISGSLIDGFQDSPIEFGAGTEPVVGLNNDGQVAITYVDTDGTQKVLPAQLTSGNLIFGDKIALSTNQKHVSVGVALGEPDIGLLTVDTDGNVDAIAASFE